MLIKKLVMIGLVGITIFSLLAMEKIEYSNSWITPVLVINEFFKNKNMPKDIANNIWLHMWKSELKPTAERVHWATQLSQFSNSDDKPHPQHIRVMFFNKEEKEKVTSLINALVPYNSKNKNIKPLTEAGYEDSLASMPPYFREGFHVEDKVKVEYELVESESKLKQIINDTFDVFQGSFYGAVIGAFVHCVFSKTYVGLPNGISLSAGIGASFATIGMLLQNWFKVRAPQKTIEYKYCPVMSPKEKGNNNGF